MVLCRSCLRVAGSLSACICGKSDIETLTHFDGRKLSSIKGKNKKKKQKKAALLYLQNRAEYNATQKTIENIKKARRFA
jgi:hypothetical protein